MQGRRDWCSTGLWLWILMLLSVAINVIITRMVGSPVKSCDLVCIDRKKKLYSYRVRCSDDNKRKEFLMHTETEVYRRIYINRNITYEKRQKLAAKRCHIRPPPIGMSTIQSVITSVEEQHYRQQRITTH